MCAYYDSFFLVVGIIKCKQGKSAILDVRNYRKECFEWDSAYILLFMLRLNITQIEINRLQI